MRRPVSLPGASIVIVLAATSLAGCGGSDGGSFVLPPRPTTETTVPSAATVPAAVTAAPPGPAPTTVPAASWQPVTGNLEGLTSECGNMSYVSADEASGRLIAGIARQGLWATTADGEAWTQLGQGPGSDVITNRTSSIVYDPDAPGTFWESGIYNDGGVYKTTDGGTTFTQLGDVTHSDRVSVDLSDPQRRTLLSGTHERPTVFRSADGGTTWVDVTADLPPDSGQAFAPLVIDSQTHLVGTKSGPSPGIFRTTDGGDSWTRVADRGVITALLISPIDGAIYGVAEGGGALLKSTDEGATWEEIPGRISAGANALLELPDGRFVTMSDRFLIVSEDRGTSWTPIGAPLPYEQLLPNGVTYSPSRKAFYVWRFDCIPDSDNPVPADAIMRLDFDAAAS